MRYRALDEELYVNTITANFISCRFCHSKLNRIHISTNRCPVCKAELRPESKLQAIREAQRKLDVANQQLQDETDKLAKAYGTVKWLVKYEFHT